MIQIAAIAFPLALMAPSATQESAQLQEPPPVTAEPIGTTEEEQAERAAARLAELEAEHTRLKDDLVARHMAAKTDEEREALPDVNHGPWEAIKPRFVAASKEFAGTPGAVPFLLWTVRMSARTAEKAEALAAIDRLLADHADDERAIAIAPALPRYAGALGVKRATEIADGFEAGSKTPEAKGAFRFASIRAQGLAGKARLDALKDLVTRYPDTNAAQSAASWAFELERLQVGMVVPEVIGKTLAGETFRLSDHRGEVVLLEFWSINCGHCIAKIPRSAERVRRLADQPFLHVGVRSDQATSDDVLKVVQERGIKWPVVADQSVDGRPFGPVGTQWNLSGWPTVYLIDHEGIIRSNRATEKVLETMLPALLERAQK